MALADRLALHGFGFNVWIDQKSLQVGDRWDVTTEKAIYEADLVIVCLSLAAVSSGLFLKESEMILKVAATKPPDSIFLIPVRLEECPVPKSLQHLYYVDLFAENGYARLEATLGQVVDSRNRKEPVPIQKASSSRRTRKAAGIPSPVSDTPPAVSGAPPPVSSTPDTKSDKDDPSAAEDVANEATAQPPRAHPGRLFGQGSKGADVTLIQQRLTDLGFVVAADGIFGRDTQQAVLAFQQKHDLRSKDGKVGPVTWGALFSTASDVADKDAAAETEGSENLADGAGTATPQSIKEGLAEEARERNALNDKPIDDFSNDTLKFKDYVLALRDFVASQSTTTPLSISINGAWGSGKSSLMRMLQRQLEPETVRFWRPQLRWLAAWFWGTLFWGEKPAEPRPPIGLWLVQLRWLAGWCWGTCCWQVGQALAKAGTRNSDYIRFGLAFDPPDEVIKQNFEPLFVKFIDHSLQDLPVGAALDEERERRLKETRFWARQAARRRKLIPRRHPTIWFNAWKFNEQEQVWAALATAVLDQLKGKYGFFARLAFVSQLTFKRTDKLGTLKHLLRKLVVPIVLAALVVIFQLKRDSLSGYLPQIFRTWSWLTGKLIWLAPALAAAWQALKAIDDPFKLPTEELVDQPDYKAKIGFIGTFEEDFQRIVRVAVRRSIFWQPRKLVIFIDDLDRCSPTQTAGIVEAINLFLDSVGCVFVLGMDMAAVAISIEVKYKDLAERMRKDAPDSVSPGILFLDKIIQIPFNVPRPNRSNINALIKQITEPETRKLPIVRTRSTVPSSANTEPSPVVSTGPAAPVPPEISQTPSQPPPMPVIDRAGFAQSDIREAIGLASNLLKENPRQVKRFINLFRLQVYVAHERGMLSDDNVFGLTPRKLAVWVAWYMQWPDIVKLLSSNATSSEARENLAEITNTYVVMVDDHDPNAGWWIRKPDNYIFNLRAKWKEAGPLHWSQLPWHLWIRDSDFAQCLKELERYWGDPKLLESILDMTQVTASPSPAASAMTEALSAKAVTGPPADRPEPKKSTPTQSPD